MEPYRRFYICVAGIYLILALLQTSRIRRYTPLQGICVRMDASRFGILGSPGQGTFRYEFEGESYIHQECFDLFSPRIRVGDTCKLYIDPQEPHTCLTPADRVNTVWMYVFFLGFLFAAVWE